jgi:2-polyprenyl-3-methyl-5-hydroxy-6-metoxy-1,4-benzoquinol methylase
MFSDLRPAVDRVLQSFDVEQSTHFKQIVRDELSKVNPQIQISTLDKKRLNELYELRSQYLDWELGTGYLGFFSENAGTRYTFTRRMEVIHQMLPFSFFSCQRVKNIRILEIGCGVGLLCLELAPMAEVIVGIDISFFVLDFANKVKEYLQYENVSFQIGDAEDLTFQDRVFDLVICSEVLEHLISPEKALSEIRRVVKDTGMVILTTPSAVSLSNISMSLLRIFNKHIESEKNIYFDKKTYFAIKRKEDKKLKSKKLPEFQKTPGVLNDRVLNDETFIRIHERFRYHNLITMFHNSEFDVEQAAGAVFAFPPHYQVFYRYCPVLLLPFIRGLERLLNRLHLFRRFGAVTTCFRLKPVRDA